MAGTISGGQKAAQTTLKKHGKDFYKRIGKKGGQNGHTGGFASNPQLARIAGRKGGKKSKRGPAKQPKQPHYKGNKIQNAHDLYNVLRSYIQTPNGEQKNDK
jgi:general stress protein YciG